MSDAPLTWVLLGDKTGDNNQLLALAERLGWPFQAMTLEYNLIRAVPPRYLGRTLATLATASRARIKPPWPDLILAIGRRAVPIARWVRHRSGGRTKLVLVGHPRVDPALFDLVITTNQYPVPPRDNVLMLALAMSRPLEQVVTSDTERDFLKSLPRPHLLLAIGGPTKYWELDEASLETAIEEAKARADQRGGTLMVTGSRRTPAELLDRVCARLEGTRHRLISGKMPRFALLLNEADELFVTADSISMLSEAIQTGKPVGMVPISLSPKGRRVIGGANDMRHGWGYGRRDLRRIWAQLRNDGLVGTVAEPRAGTVWSDSAETATAAVRALMRRAAEGVGQAAPG